MELLSEYHQFAEEIARKGGAMILDAFQDKASNIHYKHAVDLVTDTDRAVEKMILDSIRTRYPDHMLVGEESVAAGNLVNEVSNSPTWIVDPIDGTTNFVHRFPFCCISIALAINKEVVVGVVYSPVLNEFYSARKGNGSFFNGDRLQVANKNELCKALVGTGFPYDRSESNVDLILRNLRQVLLNCRDIRRAGSAALDMCYVARGVFDMYYEVGVFAWDVAAGILIVQEAGGVVHDVYGGPFIFGINRIVCGNSELVEKFHSIIPKP